MINHSQSQRYRKKRFGAGFSSLYKPIKKIIHQIVTMAVTRKLPARCVCDILTRALSAERKRTKILEGYVEWILSALNCQ